MKLTNTQKQHLIFVPITVLLFIICYYDTLIWMYDRYMASDSYYSHGFIVPFVSGFFIWLKREELNAEKAEYSRFGLILIILAAIVHVLGIILYVYSISGFSIFILIFGVTLFLFGWKISSIIFFPLVFFIFMFPMPLAIISAISFPMKMLVAKAGVEIVRLLGIPVFREGFNISIPAGDLLVGNPCSGLRSLIAFLALGSVFAYMSSMSHVKKWVLFFLTVPIAIFSNMVRVPILILISHYWGLEAASTDSIWHDASGVFVFVIGLIMLFYSGRILEWKQLETDT